MSYKLYTDKQENFECKIYLEGASLEKAKTRILVESSDINLVFDGTIDKNGNCNVPIKKLKGYLKENDTGKMKLEVIAEDTYFEPWESNFLIDTAKKIKVEVKQQNKPIIKSSKPKMVVKEVKHPFDSVDKLVNVLYKKGITPKKLIESKSKIVPVLSEYSKQAGYKKGLKSFIKEVVYKLSKK